MNKYLAGAAAGAVATIFHTAVMWALHPRLSRARQRPLPPVEITSKTARRANLQGAQARPGLVAATSVAHVGFGALAGTLYPPLADRARFPPAALGVVFGVGVWAASYLGWIPALRLLPPATRQPAQRNIMMILAHVAWGAALGLSYDALRKQDRGPAKRE